MTMFEDPWKDLLPRKDQTPSSAISGLVDTKDTPQGGNTGDDGEQTVAIVKLTDPDTAGKSDSDVALDSASSIPNERQSAERTCGHGITSDHIPQRTEICDQSLR